MGMKVTPSCSFGGWQVPIDHCLFPTEAYLKRIKDTYETRHLEKALQYALPDDGKPLFDGYRT